MSFDPLGGADSIDRGTEIRVSVPQTQETRSDIPRLQSDQTMRPDHFALGATYHARYKVLGI
jgi:hypothetical protein